MSSPLIWNGSNAKALTNDILLSNTSFNTLRVGNSTATNTSTGIISGGVLAINGGNPALFDLSAGTGIIITYTTPTVPTYQTVSWNAFSAQTVTNLATSNGTYILINSAGAIVQQVSFPTAAQRRANIFIGLLGTATRTSISSANTIPDMVQSSASQEYDFFDALGPFNIAGNTVSPNGANLNINTSGGTMFQRSFNYSTTPQNPHVVTITGQAPASFRYILQSGAPGALTSTVDVAFYDVGGVRTGIPAGMASIQRVFLGANGNMFIAYGQNVYASVAAAVAAIGTDSFVMNPSLSGIVIQTAYIIMLRNATNLSTQATFAVAPRFYAGVGGGSNTVLSMQDTYNASAQPQITLASTMGGIQFLDNATPLGTTLFQVASSGAATNFLSVSSAATTVNQLIDSGLTANTAIVANASKQLTSSATTSTQLGYLSTSTSDIQAQLNSNSMGQTNLILDPKFESGAVAQWSLGTTGTLTNGLPTGTPTFGSGASGNLTISAQGSGALNGSFSLQYQHVTNQTVAGNMMATNAITIQPEFQAKVMGVKFAYSTTVNPTNGNYSGTSANSFGWALWDVTNSAWIGTAGQFNIVQSSGVGICTGTAQLPSNTTSVRFVFYNVTATSATTGGGAITLLLDDFYLGPQVSANAPALDDFTAYTPTFVGFGTVSNVSLVSRREGDSLVVQGSFQVGTPTAVTASMTLGYKGANANVSIDTTKVGNGGLSGFAASSTAASTTNFGYIGVLATTTNAVNFGIQTSTNSALVPNTGSVIAGTSSFIGVNFRVPIVGWSSNTVSSADTDTRVVSWNGSQSSQAVTGNVTDIAFTSINDRTGSWNGTQFVVPVSGDYFVASSYGNTVNWVSVFYVDGSSVNVGSTGTANNTTSSSALLTGLKAGQKISVRSNATGTISNGSFSISRLSGPAVVQSTESVNGRYFSSVSSVSGAYGTVTYATKSFDSHNAYSGGVLTIPVTGKYQFNAGVVINATYTVNSVAEIGIFINGAQFNETLTNAFVAGANALTVNVSDILSCNAGDQVTVRAISNATSPSIQANNNRNFFSWSRAGN